ncbi:DUF423 domain-containing protein [Undibacter mobilis]|uniref:DUF423 domain-containing protein n=1 Tax=Undibacter mobilis TaxID=2292256 RepID=A0A371BA74_9BRAD|nr:DUF423 domain-containing protein [Undibacter mobilis]RDV04496.1 DUF423 domain-containing protein [Undibacter mobilis]
MDTLFIILAGLMGAAGVVLAAAGAHGAKTGMGLDSAAYLLLIHACAVIAVTVATRNGLTLRPLGQAATAGFVIGAALFAGDLALRAFAGHRLFPFAAPTGGTIMIVAWLALAVAALLRR